jgi:hypothetical protein
MPLSHAAHSSLTRSAPSGIAPMGSGITLWNRADNAIAPLNAHGLRALKRRAGQFIQNLAGFGNRKRLGRNAGERGLFHTHV